VVTNSFLAAGGGEYTVFKDSRNIQDSFHYLRNVIAEYVKKHSPVRKTIEGRIVDVARK
jgi:hypothetical protein